MLFFTFFFFERYFEADDKLKPAFINSINSNSLKVLNNCLLEPDLKSLESDIPVQFERIGYFFKDKESSGKSLVFNRTVALRDTWSKK